MNGANDRAQGTDAPATPPADRSQASPLPIADPVDGTGCRDGGEGDRGTEAAAPTTPPAGVMLAPAGWFGKIPALGDFARRRLPDSFVERWDSWLQAGMAHGRASRGEQWLDLYLTFPVWRFLIPPETPGADAWCGVLLPSVDRVGRCFPLTIARTCAPDRLACGLAPIEAELAPLAQAGLAALEGESIDAFDSRLAAGPPNEPVDGQAATVLGRAGARLLLAGLAGRSLWWAFDADAAEPTLRLEPALLSPELFASLVAG